MIVALLMLKFGLCVPSAPLVVPRLRINSAETLRLLQDRRRWFDER